MSTEINTPSLPIIERRSEYYDLLFRDDRSGGIAVDGAELSVTSLCRKTHSRGRRSPDLNAYLGSLPGAIEAILDNHQQAAIEGTGEAIFSFRSPDDKKIVSDVVVGVFKNWEITLFRRNREFLAPKADHPSRWLVIETAAAVLATANVRYGIDIRNKKNDRTVLARAIACWGPESSRRWFSGETLDSWLADQQMTSDERLEWRRTFDPSLLKRFIESSPGDPMSLVLRLKNNLENTLTDENIARHLNWTEERVAEIFTLGVKKRLAATNASNPMSAVSAWLSGKRRLGPRQDAKMRKLTGRDL
jgi:hypothetical protein